MKYRLVHITENGPYDYTLRIEECVSVWSRFFGFKEPRMYTIRGDGRGYWQHIVCGIDFPSDLIDFANEAVNNHDRNLRFRK